MTEFSFIIIGRNEGWKITNCIESIYNLIRRSDLIEYEILYIDSNSEDDTIERVKKFPNIRIFKIIDNYNAAIGRNLGASKATGEIFIFVDGDAELSSDMFNYILDADRNFKYDFVSGNIIDIIYDSDGNFKGEFPRTYKDNESRENADEEKEEVFVGGLIFICKKSIWIKVGGMNAKFRRSQDRDLSLNVIEHGIKLVRRKEIFAKHHTVNYLDSKRMWKMIFDGSHAFRAVLFRDHICNGKYLKMFLREEYSLLSLLAFGSFAVINPIFLIGYPIIVFFRCKIKTKTYDTSFIQLAVNQILRDTIVFFAVFFYFPSKKSYKYFEIN